MNRVSNSCKIGQIGNEFFGDVTFLGGFSCKICVKGDFFLEILRMVVLPSFVIFLLKDPLNLTCLGVRLLHHYLFRVKKKYFFRVLNPTVIVV